MSLADAQQRQQAIDPNDSFIVQAPAGSGKTELLIQRYLSLLAVVDAPEQIIAITFTRKAAAEMQTRVLTALEHAKQGRTGETAHEKLTLRLAKEAITRDEECEWNLFQSPSRFKIQTIDALCSSLVRQMPLLSHTGSHPEINNDPESLYEQAAIQTLNHLFSDDEWSQSLAEIILWLDNDAARFKRLIMDLLAKREQWVGFVTQKHDREEIEQTLQDIIQQHLAALIQKIPTELHQRLSDLVRFACINLNDLEKQHPLLACFGLEQLPDDNPDNLAQWLGLQSLLLKSDGDWRQRINKNDGFPAPSSNKLREHELKQQKENMQNLLQDLALTDGLKALLYSLRTLPSSHYEDSQWNMVEAMHRVLHLAVAKLILVFQQNNCIDFTQITQAAIQALGEDDTPTDLALYLDHKIQHILVDEFQDISASQYRLLEGLIAGWSTQETKSLFLVGDPMQSIYRFREAEVGLFIKTWQQQRLAQIQLQCLRLNSNFRSHSPVIDWVNTQFTNIFPGEDNVETNAVSYSPSHSTKSDLKESGVEINPILNKEDVSEAREILSLIQSLLQRYPQDNIAILVRSRNHLNSLLPILNNNDIPYHANEIAKLSRVSIVQDLLALTRAYLYLDDRIAWLSVLRAPWCGLRLTSLQKLVHNDRHMLIWDAVQTHSIVEQLEKEEQQRLIHLRDIFSDALDNKHRCSLRRAIESIWLRLHGNFLLEKDHDYYDAEKFFTLLSEFEEGDDIVNISTLEKRLDKIFTGYGNPQTARVHIMTMHKAKGLEFDHVILPGLGKRPAINKNELMMWSMLGDLSDSKLVLAPIKSSGDEHDPIYSYLKEYERQKQYFEDARLLYVASTRAIKTLHLFGHVTDKRESSNNADDFTVNKQSLLAYLWPELSEMFTEKLTHLAISDSDSNTVYIDQNIRRRCLDWTPPEPPVYFENQNAPDVDEEQVFVVEYDWAGENIRRIGTAVHRYIQSIGDNSTGWLQRDFSDQRRAISAYLEQLGIDKDILPQATGRVIRALSAMQSDPRAKWILDEQHSHIENEFSMTGFVQGKFKRIKIDRTFIDQNNVRWIIDYKSSRHDAAGADEFLDQEQIRYKQQLENYAEIIRHFDRDRTVSEIRLGLYFPLLQGWREWQYQ